MKIELISSKDLKERMKELDKELKEADSFRNTILLEKTEIIKELSFRKKK